MPSSNGVARTHAAGANGHDDKTTKKGRQPTPSPAPRRSSSSQSDGRRDDRGSAASNRPRTGGHDKLFKLLVIVVLVVANVNLYFYERHHADRIDALFASWEEDGGGSGTDRGGVWPSASDQLYPLDKRRFSAAGITRRNDGTPSRAGAIGSEVGRGGRMVAPPPPGAVESGASRKGTMARPAAAADTAIDPANDHDDDGKLRVVQILRRAAIPIDDATRQSLPQWSDVVDQYGSEPVIQNLDTDCAAFQKAVPPHRRMLGPAGLFNTGTNVLSKLLAQNCHVPGKVGPDAVRWQVPWGKHCPAWWRNGNVAAVMSEGIVQNDVLPVVLIKEPYHWMGSMCRHDYTCNWNHRRNGHCPNLVPWRSKHPETDYTEARIRYNKTHVTKHKSLTGVWNDWYQAYENATYPKIYVRFEDLLFFPETVVKMSCECAGGKLYDRPFQYFAESAKGTRPPHRDSNGLVASIVRYGNESKRLEGFTDWDRRWAAKTLDKERMDRFAYHPPPLPP